MADRSFQKVIEEVRSNLEELKKDSARIAKDLAIMESWVRKRVNDQKTDPWRVGFTYSFLSSSALEVARINQLLSFLWNEKVLDISEVYATQEFYAEKSARVFDVMGELQGLALKPESQDFFSSVQKFRFHMALIFNTVKAYMKESQKFLDTYDTKNSIPSSETEG